MTMAATTKSKMKKLDRPPAYAELQAMFQRALMEGDDSVLAEILDSSKEKRDTLLGVYRNAYVIRLRSFLINDYPALLALMGEEDFDRLAWSYIMARPSKHANARWYSDGLPEFISLTSPFSDRAELGELARFEQALADAFDAREAPVVSLTDLAAIPPDDWSHLVFTPQPSVCRLNFQTNAVAIWRAAQKGWTNC